MVGREKEVIILSLVRNNDERNVGFLSEKRRLNVAITRPKRHLCVVADGDTLRRGHPFLKKWIEWLNTTAEVRYPEV